MDYRSESKNSYLRAKTHLDEIIEQIRSKDVPLEKALDLYEEAIRIGNSCADLIDKTDFSLEELEAFNASRESANADVESESESVESASAEGEGESVSVGAEGENENADAEGESVDTEDASAEGETQDASSATDSAEAADDDI